MDPTPNKHVVQARRKRRDHAKMDGAGLAIDRRELTAIEATLEDVDFPPQVIVEVTNACNLRCEMCAHRILTRPHAIMEESLFNKILEEIATEAPHTRIWVSFYGEALLAKEKLWKFIRRAKAVGPLHLTLNSNGTMLDDEKIEHLVHEGLSRIVFSIDGLSKEIYERFRRGARHEEVYAAVPKVIEAARINGDNPEIIVQIIDMPGNRHEIPDFIKFWTDLGVVVKVKNLVTWTGAAVERSALDEWRIACPWVITTFPITVIGEALLCGADYDANVPLGNVHQHSIKALWARHRRYRRIHLEKCWDELPELCTKCTDWQTVGSRVYYPDGRQAHLGIESKEPVAIGTA